MARNNVFGRIMVCSPASVSLRALSEIGLTDLVTMEGCTDTRTSFYRKSDRFAGYMLVSPKVDVRRALLPDLA